MQPRKSLLLLGTCLSALLCLGFGGCKNGPDVTIYISDPKERGMEYSNDDGTVQGFVPYEHTDKFVCFTPGDAQTLINFCGASKAP